jgi:hypothetical protein
MHAQRLIVLALFSLIVGLPGSSRADDKATPAPAAAEHQCPHAKQAGGDCPCKKEGAKGDCPCAKGGDCPCAKEGGKADCPCAKGGECSCAKDCKCPHCQQASAKSDPKADKPSKKAKKTK